MASATWAASAIGSVPSMREVLRVTGCAPAAIGAPVSEPASLAATVTGASSVSPQAASTDPARAALRQAARGRRRTGTENRT